MANIARVVRLNVGAGVAKPGPAIGQALGPLGLNMMEFCKAFNSKTSEMIPSTPIPVLLTAYNDRTFTFEVRTPPTTHLLMKCAGIEKGSENPGGEYVGEVSVKACYEIAKMKQTESHLTYIDLRSLTRSVVGTAASIGVKVIHDVKKKEAPTEAAAPTPAEEEEPDAML